MNKLLSHCGFKSETEVKEALLRHNCVRVHRGLTPDEVTAFFHNTKRKLTNLDLSTPPPPALTPPTAEC